LSAPTALLSPLCPSPRRGDDQLVVDVLAGGVSFVDLLLSRGLYQLRPDPPFTLGLQLAGTTPDGGRVAAVSFGAFAERVAVPSFAALPLPTTPHSRRARRSS
jgi:NADPH:quinone reductase